MAYDQQDEQACFVTGFIKESRNTPGSKFVSTAVVSLNEIKDLVCSDMVEILIFDSKKDPLTRKTIKIKKGDPKYFKSLKDFQKSPTPASAPQASGPSAGTYGTASADADFIP